MRRSFVPVLVLALLAVVLMGGAAYGVEPVVYTEPGECYTCHGVSGTGAVGKVDFDVPAVNYDKCKTCHAGVSNLQHWHNLNLSRCTGCHLTSLPIIVDVTWRFTSTFVSPDYGVFKTSASLTSSPQTLHAAHSGTGWVNSLVFKAGSTANCANCHRAATCSACHGDTVAHTDHAVTGYPGVSYAQSTGTGMTTEPSTCVNAACHDLAKAAAAEFVPWCGTCHPARAEEHGYDTIDHVADDSDIEGMACSACHSLDLATVHGDPGAEGASCATCHPMPRKTFGAWDQACATGGCHTVSSTRPMHADIVASHTVSEANTLCLDCHTGTELASIHVGAKDEATGKTSCFVCHTGTAGEPATSDCASCHFTFENHYGAERHTSSWAPLVACSGAECHSASGDLMTIHVEKDASFTCAGCHSSFRVAGQIRDGLTGCGDCHDGVTQSSGHRDIHGANPSLETTTHVPNYAYYTGSTGTPKTIDCVGCHTSNLVDEHLGLFYGGAWIISPRFSSAGSALTCSACHSSADSTVLGAIDSGLSSCESCHPVHGPIAAVHATTFDSSTGVDCAQCHSAQLETEHNGTYTTTTPSGRKLAGCAVCHSYWEGERGALVEGVISANGQTQCSACHGTQHPDLGSHAATSTASVACAVCHDEGGTSSIDVKAVHADAGLGTCAVCHDNADRVSAIDTLSAECASCHATEGTDYHTLMGTAHTYSAMDASCTGAGCHVAKTLPEEHERFLARYTDYDTTCELCHENTDAPRIDWTTATASCDSCHTVHGDIAQIHTAANSQGCVDCHETGDAIAIHKTDTGQTDCALCHAAPAGRIDWAIATIECGSCHGALRPVETNHYPLASHDATEEAGCGKCHFKDMKAEHFKSNVAVGCVQCHENSVDQFTTPWDKTCTSCHATKHGDKRTKHTSTTTGCGGAGCHDVSDVEAIHRALTGGGCGACHQNASVVPTTTDCTVSGCHAGVGTSHHEAHNAASTNPGGCNGCHNMYLDDEHAVLGMTCDTCHASTVVAVQTAIAVGDTRCRSCHPAMHSAQDFEFNPNQAGGHRVSAGQSGMRSSFVVNGSAYTWSLPSASSFLKTGWKTDSIMACDSCHSYSGATGPHGSTMKVNIDPAFPSPYTVTTGSSTYTAQLSPNSPTGMSMRDGGSTPAGVICEKCHDLYNGSSWSNAVHKNHDDRGDEGGYCNYCHVDVPHGWGRPRLLGYTTDDAAYAAASGGLTGIALRNYTPTAWDDNYCTVACHSHGSFSNKWPAASQTTPPIAATGSVTGTVKDSVTNAAISGATVTVGTKTATTSSTGAYRLTDVAAGSYAISVTASTYDAWTGSVSVTAGAATSQNITLVKTPVAPTATNLARTGTASASSYNGRSYTASKATDGSTSSYWRSNGNRTEWLQVDLGASKTLTSVVVNWYSGDYARSYRIETSSDGYNWTSQYSTTSGNGGIDTITLSTVSARYVRVYCTNANDSDYRIREFEVWGY